MDDGSSDKCKVLYYVHVYCCACNTRMTIIRASAVILGTTVYTVYMVMRRVSHAELELSHSPSPCGPATRQSQGGYYRTPLFKTRRPGVR